MAGAMDLMMRWAAGGGAATRTRRTGTSEHTCQVRAVHTPIAALPLQHGKRKRVHALPARPPRRVGRWPAVPRGRGVRAALTDARVLGQPDDGLAVLLGERLQRVHVLRTTRDTTTRPHRHTRSPSRCSRAAGRARAARRSLRQGHAVPRGSPQQGCPVHAKAHSRRACAPSWPRCAWRRRGSCCAR